MLKPRAHFRIRVLGFTGFRVFGLRVEGLGITVERLGFRKWGFCL